MGMQGTQDAWASRERRACRARGALRALRARSWRHLADSTKKYQQRKQKISTENYLKKKKNIKREYGRNRYKNMSEKKKQRPKEYQKSYRQAKKN